MNWSERVKSIYYSKWAIQSLLVYGILTRLAHYFSGRSMWLDEAALAVNILGRDFPGLFRVLDHAQAAPAGFLVAVKLLISLFGSSEYVFRLLPLAAGIAALLLFYPLARKALNAGAVPLAVGLFVFSDRAIYYAGETKQYSVDLFFAVLILSLAYHAYRNSFQIRNLIVLGCVGTLAVWFSHPSVFLLGGAGLALFSFAWKERKLNPKVLFTLAASGLLWISSFTANYLLISGPASENPVFRAFFAHNFPPFPPLSAADIAWYPNTFISIMCDPVGFSIPHTALVATALVAGVIICGLDNKKYTLTLITLPLLFLLAASLAGFYPLAGRLLLFTLPLFYLLLGAGLHSILASVSRRHMLIGLTLSAVLFGMMAGRTLYHLARPRVIYQAGPAISYLIEKRDTGDLIYMNYLAYTMFEYYTRSGRVAYLTGPETADPESILAGLEKLPEGRRIWLLFIHDLVGEEELTLDSLSGKGRLIDSRISQGANLYLFYLE